MNDRFDADFRMRLLQALCADPDFFRKAVDFLKPEMIVERPIQFAYSVLLRCYVREGRLPSAEVMQMAALDDLNNPDIPFDQKPSAAEENAYCQAVAMACTGLSLQSTDKTSYMSSRLRDFLQLCYMSAIPSEATQSQRLELYSQIYAQMQTYDAAGSVNELSLDEALERMSETIDIGNRIGTGLSCIDVPLNGGLAPGEIGLVMAAAGTGKSNALINFACENALRGNQSAYITMELSTSVVLSRIIAILSGIRAPLIGRGTSKKAMEAWTEGERRRYHDLVDKGGKNRHILESIKIIDHSDRHVTTDTIRQEVAKWKETRIKAGIDEKKMGFVVVDWLNNVDASTLSAVSKNMNQAAVMEKVVESLRQMGVATGTRVWTAQQAARNALTKEALTMKDGRDSSGTFNPVDIALGLAQKHNDAKTGKATSGKSEELVDPSKDMLMSVMKDRNSGATGALIQFYQGPSLKFYESKKECQRAELLLRNAYS